MQTTWIVIAAAALSQVPAGIDAARFSRLVDGSRADIEDVTFLYEGSLIGLAAGGTVEDALRAAAPADPLVVYQGSYAFRSDGATRLDTLVSTRRSEGAAPPPDYHETFALLEGELLSRQIAAGGPKEQVRRERGGPGLLNRPNSPERILFLWYFHLLKLVGGAPVGGYEDLGWEEVGGHRCLKVRLASSPGAPGDRSNAPFLWFWLDVARGGHPLKVELHTRHGLMYRCAGIELARFPLAEGRDAWLPVRGYCEIFGLSDGRHTPTPVAAETYTVLDGTVRLNQGLGDEEFTIEGGRKIPTSPGLASRRAEFRGTPVRQDPAGVTQRLEVQLAAAERQARELEASSPAAAAARRTAALQVLFTCVGFILLAVAVSIYRRAR